jgi:hypothetical protein
MPSMFKHTAIVAAKMAVIVDRLAVGVISAVIVEHHAAAPVRRPSAPAPTVVTIKPDRDSYREADSEPQHDAGRRREHIIARVRREQRSPHAPRIVVGNVDQSRIHRHNQDLAVVDIHALLRGGYQRARLLRLETHGLHCVHDVAGLIVISVA